MRTQAELIEQSRQHLLAGAVLVVLFSAFFWLGYFVGKSSVVQSAAPGSPNPGPPAGERVLWRTAGR